MTIYHGGTHIVDMPRIIAAYTGRDFGKGFYTTRIRDQAIKWAKRQAVYRNKAVAILNSYVMDDSVLNTLNTKTFSDYSMEWLDFVIECRSNAAYRHDYDIVVGKIANDDVGETIQAVVDGLASKDYALAKLAFAHANDQICFSSNKALECLEFISYERVD